MTTTTDSRTTGSERSDFTKALAQHRGLLLRTVRGLDDAQARSTPTASQLCLGGIIKHVALMEEGWVRFIGEGPASMGPPDASAYESHAAGFRMEDSDTLEGIVDRYRAVARATEARLIDLPSLDASHPLPEAPWFEPGARWSARRVLVHIVAETAQHAGHADIIRESIDGSKSMG
jgi:uncharacterized damage-inducible protein DinB